MTTTREPRPADVDDVDGVVALVERAYRGEASRAGWTTEADLLDGRRTDAASVRALVEEHGSTVLVLEGVGGGGPVGVVGCCHVRAAGEDGSAYVGMVAVDPLLQGRGTGRALLAAARARALSGGARRLEMTVLAQRTELVAWYARRGYRPTGERRPFPVDDERFGRPRRADLEFVVLELRLARP